MVKASEVPATKWDFNTLSLTHFWELTRLVFNMVKADRQRAEGRILYAAGHHSHWEPSSLHLHGAHFCQWELHSPSALLPCSNTTASLPASDCMLFLFNPNYSRPLSGWDENGSLHPSLFPDFSASVTGQSPNSNSIPGTQTGNGLNTETPFTDTCGQQTWSRDSIQWTHMVNGLNTKTPFHWHVWPTGLKQSVLHGHTWLTSSLSLFLCLC